MEFWTREMEKQCATRVLHLLSDKDLLAVFNTFGEKAFQRSSVFHGLASFLDKQNVRGKVCLEVGTWNGLTAIVLARRFESVVTIDVESQPAKYEIARALGIKNIAFITCRDNEEKAKFVESCDGPASSFDWAYLDGDHANDTESDFALVKHCGRVIFHEVWPFQEPVWNLVHRLPQWQIAFSGSGLALWDRTRDRRAI